MYYIKEIKLDDFTKDIQIALEQLNSIDQTYLMENKAKN